MTAPDARGGPSPTSGRALVAEACVVAFATVVVPLAVPFWTGTAARADMAFTNAHLLSLVLYEVVLGAALVFWLRRRGWTPHQVAGDPTPIDVLRGVGLWMLAYGAVIITWIVFKILQRDLAEMLSATESFPGAPATAAYIIIGSVINPVFEEFLWLGYGVGRFAPAIGLRRAAAVSVLARTSLHLYQGPWALLAVLPLGVTVTWYYARTRRLWPVVVAHVLFDAIGLAARLHQR